MRTIRFFLLSVTLFLFAVSPLFAEDLELTSDKMRYESETGDFWADGNVKVTRGTIMATSKAADGNMNRRVFTMKGGVRVFGSWQNDKVDMKGQTLSGVFTEPQEYIFDGGVKGFWGSRQVDADKLRMKGDYFWGTKLRRYADTKEGYVLVCDSLEGKLANGEIDEFTAAGNVFFRSAPKDGEPTEIRGSKAVYSKARGTLVVSGGVTAVQAARSLKSETLIFFPDRNRVEATGKPQLIFKMEGSK
jgi:lipopolysaccharide export system protein LptA